MIPPTVTPAGRTAPRASDLARNFLLDPSVTFLNHGSFGSTPRAVLEVQREFQLRLEREPVRFMVEELEDLLDASRAALGALVHAEPCDLAFVSNITSAVNAVLRSLDFRPGDDLLTTSHEYNACNNAMRFVADRAGARVTVAPIPFPIASPDQALDAVLAAVTPRTRLAMISHVTSPTALVLPVERMTAELARRGVTVLIDGAHAPGMVNVDIRRLESLGAAFYAANCHKWLCAPKGAGFLWTRRDLQPRIRPAVISHGANSPRTDRSRYLLEFDWPGTIDWSPVLALPAALREVPAMLGPRATWNDVMTRNRALAIRGSEIIRGALSAPPGAPDDMIGSIAAVPLPDSVSAAPEHRTYPDPLQRKLIDRFRIQVPIVPFPSHPRRLVRISAQLYNHESQYLYLAEALRDLLRDEAP